LIFLDKRHCAKWLSSHNAAVLQTKHCQADTQSTHCWMQGGGGDGG